MRPALLCLLTFAATADAAPVPKTVKTKQNDTDAIVGTWLRSYEDDDPAAEPPTGRTVYSFDADGSLLIGTLHGGSTPFNYKLVSSGAIDLECGADQAKDTRAAIYTLKGDILTLCIPKSSSHPRPSAFQADDDHSLLTFRRRPAKKGDR